MEIVKKPKQAPRDDTVDRLVRIGIGLQQEQARCLSQFGLTRLQAGILLELHQPDELFGPVTMRTDQLAKALQCTSGSISPEVRRLRERRFVTLERGAKDRRERAIAITDEGRAIAQEYKDSYEALSASLFEGMRTVWHEAIDKLERRVPGVGLRRHRRSAPRAAKPTRE